MHELDGHISDRLRKLLPPDGADWYPQRPASPMRPGPVPDGVDGHPVGGRELTWVRRATPDGVDGVWVQAEFDDTEPRAWPRVLLAVGLAVLASAVVVLLAILAGQGAERASRPGPVGVSTIPTPAVTR